MRRHPESRVRLVAAIIAGAATLLPACTLGPNYARPEVEAPSAYKEAQDWKTAQPRETEPRGPWWTVFNDPQLDALLGQVEVSNQTIKAAEARVREARALTQQAQAAYFPIVTANASATRSGGRAGTGTNVNNGGGLSGGPRNNFNVALDVNWEIDLWGRVRRTVEAGEATAQASVADLEAAKLSAQAQLAEDYFLLRAQDAQIRLLTETVDAYQKSLQLTRNQYAVGVGANGGIEATSPNGNRVTLAFTDSETTVPSTEQAFKLHAPKSLCSHISDVMRSNRNVVIVWTTTPASDDESKVEGCLAS